MAEGDKKQRAPLWMFLTTLILTPILAAICSGIVVHFQLSKGHDFWMMQHEVIRHEKLLDEKIYLAKETSRLIRMANTRWITFINTHDTMRTLRISGQEKRRGVPNMIYVDLAKDITKLLTSWADIQAEMDSNFLIAEALFGDGVKKSIEAYEDYITSDKFGKDIEDMRKCLKAMTEESEILNEEAWSHFKDKWGRVRWTRHVAVIMVEMTREIAEDLKVKQ